MSNKRRIDIQKLRQDIKMVEKIYLEGECRALLNKDPLPSRYDLPKEKWQEWEMERADREKILKAAREELGMKKYYWQGELNRYLRQLYSLRAHHRNRLHQAKRRVSWLEARDFGINFMHGEDGDNSGHKRISIGMDEQWHFIKDLWNGRYALPPKP